MSTTALAGDRSALRIAVWFAIAIVVTFTCAHFKLSFPPRFTIELLAAKLTFLALIGALGVFQYGVWSQVAQRTWEQINNPQWMTVEAQVELDQMREEQARQGLAAAPALGDLRGRERALEVWHSWKAGSVRNMLEGLLPHSRIILINYLTVAYLLLESSMIDLIGLLFRVQETPLIAAISAGMFLGSFPPFIDVWWRYARALSLEFAAWRRDFQGAEPKPPKAKA